MKNPPTHEQLDRIEKIKSPHLKQAIEVIEHIMDEYGQEEQGPLVVDLHDGNVMWRLTGTGPQLVITDPLWRQA